MTMTPELFEREFAPLINLIDELFETFETLWTNPPATYSELRDMSRRLTRMARLIDDAFIKLIILETASQNNLNDAAFLNLEGFFAVGGIFGTTQYSLRSDVARARFLLENIHLVDTVTRPMGLDAAYGFMGFSIQIIILFVIIVMAFVAAGSVAGEHETGTVKLLLIRPYRRWQFLLSKMLMIAGLVFAMFLISFLALFAIGAARFGVDARDVLFVLNANTTHVWSAFSVITIQFFFAFVMCLIYAFIGIMVSTIFKSRVAAVAVTIVVAFAADIFTAILASYSWYKYVIFNNVNLFGYFSIGPSLNDMTLGFSLATIAIYMTLIIGSTFLIFKRRDAT
jgi:ABC-2 type transport system permease protein